MLIGAAWVRDASAAFWRRVFTTPDGRELCAVESRRRLFTGGLRALVVLRDDVCATPWCGAPIVHVDHVRSWSAGGSTGIANADGLCARCNYTKELTGWRVVHTPRREAGATRAAAVAGFRRTVTTPTGHRYSSRPPPLLGW